MAGEYLTPTPYANPLTGLSNDMIQGLLGYMKDKQRTQQMQGLAGLLESTGIPQTVERAAYADSPKALLDALTNVNRANVPLLKAETADAIMNVAPFVGPAARGAERAAMAAGRAGERYAEKVVPQIMERGGLPAQLLGDLSQGSIRPMDVWHGSPYRFDKFDASKIGTGEGAQAFSYGHYFGEARGTGEQYRDVLKQKQFAKIVEKGRNDFDVIAPDGTVLAEGVYRGAAQKAYDAFNKEAGNLYKVDLPDEAIANMLDWDKPYNKQPKQVQDALKNSNVAEIWKAQYGFDIEKNQPQMDMVYKAVAEQLGSPAAASQYFKDLGILGTRYLDEGSRAAGEGTSNFVVFPGGEDLLTIKEINDKPVGGLLGQSKAAESAAVLPGVSIQGGEKPLRSAVVLVGDKVFFGNTHADAISQAIKEGVIKKEAGKFIYPEGAEVDMDLFLTNEGQIIDRLQAYKMMDVGASESANQAGIMQQHAPSSMTVDEYMKQANAIRQKKEKQGLLD